MIKMLIVDEVKVLSEFLRLVVEKYPEFAVVGCVRSDKKTTEMENSEMPEIMMLDLNELIDNNHDILVKLRKTHGNARIVIFTGKEGKKKVSELFADKVEEYVLKDASMGELECVLDEALMNGKYINKVDEGLEERAIKLVRRKRESDFLGVTLTERERDVLALVTEGMTNEEIADMLGISFGRARNIVTGLISKCMVKNRTQLAVMATRHFILN